MKLWTKIAFLGFCVAALVVPASAYPLVGSYLITGYGDDNILDGIQLHSQTMDLIISTSDGLDYTATYGIGGPQLSMVRDGYLLSQYPRPQDFGSGWATNAYILSDGVNGAWVHMGQEYDNPSDISIHVAAWAEDVEVTASQLVGKWTMQGVEDLNLLDNPSAPFDMMTYTYFVTDLGGGLLDMYMSEEDVHWYMQLNGNVLEPVSTPMDSSSVYLSMMTNGQTIVFAALNVESYDETDVCPTIGFATRDTMTIDDTLAFFDASVADGTLVGSGPGNSADGRRRALRNMILLAGDLIEEGRYTEACQQLRDAYGKCDGDPKPPDFVTGEAADDLADMILMVMDALGC